MIPPDIPPLACMPARDYMARLPDTSVHLIFTSPPYLGVSTWHDAGLTDASLVAGIFDLVQQAARVLVPGGYLVVNTASVPQSNQGIGSTTAALFSAIDDTLAVSRIFVGRAPLAYRGHIIWDKGITSPLPPPCFLRRPCIPHITHEDIHVFVKGDWHARELRTGLTAEEKPWLSRSIWTIKPVTSRDLKIGRNLRFLTLPFPLALADRVVRLFSLPGEIVLDPFCGVGTALVAARQNDRFGYGCDTNPDAIACASEWLASIEEPHP